MNWLNYLFSETTRKDSILLRSAANALEGWVSIGVNLLLFAAKLSLGLLTGSIALTADAFHTLSDMGTSIILIVSARIARRPSDAEHPFGHQRAEAIATIVIATLLFVTGIELGHSAILRILHPAQFSSEWWIIGVILGTVVVKELLAQFARKLGQTTGSQTLLADSWHHRSDAITTLVVVITFVAGKYGFFSLDGYVGTVMALFIMYTGYDISRESMNQLLGKAPDPEYLQRVTQIAYSIPEVRDVHDVILHQYGDNKVLSLHIEVSESLSLNHAHEIAERVERKIEKELRSHATVHFEPTKKYDIATEAVRSVIHDQISEDAKMKSYHALRTERQEQDLHVFFDLVVEQGTSQQEIENIRKSLTDAIMASSGSVKEVTIRIEPTYPFKEQL